MEKSLYVFTIELLEAKPKIWRRFYVPSTIDLERFHNIIQTVMGWESSHLFAFIVKEQRYMPEESDGGTLEPCEHLLSQVVSQKGEVMSYIYDMGDNWEHKLILDDPKFTSPDGKREIGCLDGARACPPEDIGGIYGYKHLCKVMANPKHKEYKKMRDWLTTDQPYDPELFDLKVMNNRLSIV
ncbi:MAG: plasmid pRiA4b ORF-3 family protein [Planctomycetota bacterium]|jgi:hypothetical protein|nr:plasmid pRiA4b ORF-3 family protein [Planctomycetota bacterium]